MDIGTYERIVFNLQDYNISRGLSFGHYRYNVVKPGLESHRHEGALEICFCLKGHQFYRVRENLFELKGDDIFIINPNTNHSTGIYPEDKGELFWIQILVDNTYGSLCNLPEEHSDYLLRSLMETSELVFQGAFQLKLILEKLASLLEGQDSILSRITVNQLIVQLLMETMLLSKKPQKITPSVKMNILDDFIMQNLHRIIYVDEMAGMLNLSTGYFKGWFKSTSGMPPKEYINRLKVEQAKSELLKKKMITEVAFDLGFSSSQYFATVFKKFTGYTPGSYILLNER